MSKVLVVCYSFTGTGRRLAQMLGATQGWPVAEITESGGHSRGTLRCVLDSLLRRKPAVRYDGPPPESFDTVVLVAPIWAYQLASPMRSFVAEQASCLRSVAVACVMGGRGAPNAFAEIGQLLRRSPVLCTAFTAREVDDGSCAGRLQAFAHALADPDAEGTSLRPASLSARAA